MKSLLSSSKTSHTITTNMAGGYKAPLFLLLFLQGCLWDHHQTGPPQNVWGSSLQSRLFWVHCRLKHCKGHILGILSKSFLSLVLSVKNNSSGKLVVGVFRALANTYHAANNRHEVEAFTRSLVCIFCLLGI